MAEAFKEPRELQSIYAQRFECSARRIAAFLPCTTINALRPMAFVRLDLKFRPAWRPFGRQFPGIAEKPVPQPHVAAPRWHWQVNGERRRENATTGAGWTRS